MKKVKNISDQDLAIPNVGIAKAGEIISVGDDFHNANFVEVGKEKSDERANEKDEEKEEETAPKSGKNKK